MSAGSASSSAFTLEPSVSIRHATIHYRISAIKRTFDDGRIVAEGTNLVTSTNDPTAHAEIAAIRGACRSLGRFQLPGCEIYTSCEPCPMCLGAIYWARLNKVFFGCTRAVVEALKPQASVIRAEDEGI
jgi:tRNA(Arg) A34 adenosine deaminase TadA